MSVPQLNVDRTVAPFGDTGTIYSSTLITYSSSSQVYGGVVGWSDLSDQKVYIEDNKPILFQPIDNKPKIDRVSVL